MARGQLMGQSSSGGITGYTGSAGYTGSQGVGYTGSVGSGFTGSQGIQGLLGYTGSRGYTGTLGYTGSLGYSGSQGIQGFTGSLGYSGSKGETGTSLTLTGVVASSSNLPSSGNVIGDTYLTSDTGHIWIWGNGIWNDGGQFTGYTGSRGVDGVIGYNGSIGYTGSRGYVGSAGYIYVGEEAPITPFDGMLWSDTTTDSPIGERGFTGSIGYTGSLGYTGSIGGAVLPYLISALSADVELAISNQWYDGPSVLLTSGTWLINTHLTQHRATTTAEFIYSRVSDGTTHYASTQQYHPSVSGISTSISLTTMITVASNTTIYLQAATSVGSANSLMKASLVTNGSGDNATQITAIKVS